MTPDTVLIAIVRASGSPNNALVVMNPGNDDQDLVFDHACPQVKTVAIIDLQGGKGNPPLTMFQRASSSPNNASVFMFFDSAVSDEMGIVIPTDAYSFLDGFAHNRGDFAGNARSDQKMRGGIAG